MKISRIETFQVELSYAGTELLLGVKPDTQVLGEPLAIYTES